MQAEVRQCARCRHDFVAKTARATYCSTRCRTAATRARAVTGGAVVIEVSSAGRPEPELSADGLLASVTAQLVKAERLASPAAQAAVALANRIERSALIESGAGVARMIETLMTMLDRAMEGAQVELDLVDEMQKRRDAKRDRAAAG